MLTDDQVRQFNNQGYLVVEDVIPDALMARVRAEYTDVMDRLYADWFQAGRIKTPPGQLDFWGKLSEAYRAGCDWFQPMDISLPGDRITLDTPFHFGPAVFDLLRTPRLLDIAEALIGPELTSTPIQHVRIKPPAMDLRENENRAHITMTDWHQDRAVAHAEADQTRMVTVWIAMTDATVENGCLQVLPMGANQDVLPHCPKLQTAIADGFIDEARARPLPVGAGGIVMLHPLTPHSSLVNRTSGFRWSFDIRYNVTGQPTGRAHFPEFVARSRAAPETELRDWQVWKTLWETARKRLAQSPHIDIHRWTSDAPYCA